MDIALFVTHIKKSVLDTLFLLPSAGLAAFSDLNGTGFLPRFLSRLKTYGQGLVCGLLLNALDEKQIPACTKQREGLEPSFLFHAVSQPPIFPIGLISNKAAMRQKVV